MRTLDGDHVRIESNTENGIPDINTCLMGFETWIESKIVNRGVQLRKEQYAWATRRCNAGGSIFVLAFNPYNNLVVGWMYPQVRIVSNGDGKYVTIINDPAFNEERGDRNIRLLLRKFIFPAL
jgi:hypothetical protein